MLASAFPTVAKVAVWLDQHLGGELAFIDLVIDRVWIRRRGGRSVPDDGLAIEIGLDSYSDVEMGSSLYLELMAYCGTEGVGDLAWKVFDDDHLERRFAAHLEGETLKLLGEHVDVEGVRCSVEVTEVEEI